MKLIVGLGNPGEKYALTRHNVGFKTIAALAEKYHIDSNYFKLTVLMGKGIINGQKIMLAQPTTYMNNSGKAVRLLLDYFKIPLEELVIIYDDLDLLPGQIRIKQKGGSGGHNGLKSIISHLGTQEFARIRIGIGRPPEGEEVVDYVLGRPSPEEENLIDRAIDRTVEAVEEIIEQGFQEAMNKFN